MKKILLILNLLFIIILTGCSCNKEIFDTNYRFDYALVYENGQWVKYEINKWDDYDNDIICIWTKDGKMIYSSSVNIILIND